jgi:hypothetical protein
MVRRLDRLELEALAIRLTTYDRHCLAVTDFRCEVGQLPVEDLMSTVADQTLVMTAYAGLFNVLVLALCVKTMKSGRHELL